MELVFSLRILQKVIDMKESVVNKVRMFPSKKYLAVIGQSKWVHVVVGRGSWKKKKLESFKLKSFHLSY